MEHFIEPPSQFVAFVASDQRNASGVNIVEFGFEHCRDPKLLAKPCGRSLNLCQPEVAVSPCGGSKSQNVTFYRDELNEESIIRDSTDHIIRGSFEVLQSRFFVYSITPTLAVFTKVDS
jgi:hypothetical protein